MSELKLHAVVNDAKSDDYIDIECNMTMEEIVDTFYDVITNIVDIEDEEEFHTLLHMLVLSSIKDFKDIE